jgi:hypothetical protein
VKLLTGDATKLSLPDGPLMVFLFNPFGPARWLISRPR